MKDHPCRALRPCHRGSSRPARALRHNERDVHKHRWGNAACCDTHSRCSALLDAASCRDPFTRAEKG